MPLAPHVKQKIQSSVATNVEALNGSFATQLKKLLSLSMTELSEIAPEISHEEYSKLVSVVRHASQHNENMAALVDEIKTMGANAIEVAKAVGVLV